jgi:hypoxia up-regulated 1
MKVFLPGRLLPSRALLRQLLLPLLLISISLLPHAVDSKAILGVDLGSQFMKVALVQRGAPLEIVTNLHAKRKTEQMILFDAGTRLYGADADSLYARKPHVTPSAMSILLGRTNDHPTVQVSTDTYRYIHTCMEYHL